MELIFSAADLLGTPEQTTEPDEQHVSVKKTSSRGVIRHCTEGCHPQCIRLTKTQTYRSSFSTMSLLDLIDGDFKDGESCHFMTGGDIDSLSFLKVMLMQQDLDYLLMATWVMNMSGIMQLCEWIRNGKIKRLDFYAGEPMDKGYHQEGDLLRRTMEEFTPSGRICIFNNHSKVLAGVGKKYAFGIESSANVNKNPRNENTCINIGNDIFNFYKDFYDKINAYNAKDFPDWKPWIKPTA